MLPVPHQACTLATGALRSSWTSKVNPFGKTNFFDEFGGNVITSDFSPFLFGAAGVGFEPTAFKFTMLHAIAQTSATRGALPIIQFWAPANFLELGPFSPEQTASRTLPENRRRI